MRFDDPAWLEEERRCLRALRRGDRAAFTRLYRAFAEPLTTRVLLPRLGDMQAAEDALAETFETMLEKLDTFEDRGGGIWPWLSTVAANKARDLGRRQARDGRGLRSFELLVGPLADEAAPGQAAPGAAGVASAAVAAVLAGINPRYRRALELRFFEERPRVDCAALLEVKVGTFDVILLRALRAFRDAWQAKLQAEAQGAPPAAAAPRPPVNA